MPKTITLTTKVASFTFESHVILSRAKLIRDTILSQFLNPKPTLPKIKNEDDCYKVINALNGSILSEIPFSVSLEVR